MKISAFLLFCCLVNIFAAPTYSQATKISLNLKDATIEDVLNKIEDVSEFYFLYNNKLIDVTRKVNIEADKEPIKDILNDILSKDTKFIVYDRQIILTPSDVTSLAEALQQLKITGTVMDKNGPIPGANVVVTGTTQGTITDITGKYSIEVPQGAKSLTFSFVGMEPQVVIIGTLTQINVTMAESAVGLDEVVVVGYGTQKKASLTGSVAAINDKIITTDATPINITNVLAGRVPGLVVVNQNGMPGSGSSINIRGTSTFGDNSALVVVDGIIMDNGLDQIDPNEIQSISVLKDAASAAIYGSRGANGVILITTKRGQLGKPRFEYSGFSGYQQPTVYPDLMDAYHYAVTMNEALKNDNKPPSFTDQEIADFKSGKAGEDYFARTFKKRSFQTQQDISVRGGTEAMKYFLSLGYLSQDGMFDNINYKRYSVRSNVDAKINSNLTISGDLSVNSRQNNYSGWNTDQIFHDIVQATPTISEYNPDGSLNYAANYASEEIKTGYERQRTTNIYVLLSFKQDLPFITKGLALEGKASLGLESTKDKHYEPPVIAYHGSFNDPAPSTWGGYNGKTALDESFNDYNTTQLDIDLRYDRTFGDHHISGLVLFEQFSSKGSNINAFRTNFPSIGLDELLYGGQLEKDANGGSFTDGRMSYVARADYSYKERYLLGITFRADGSVAFPVTKKYGYFPAFSAGWILSQEPFFHNNDGLSFIDNLKLRASYGKVGNDRNVYNGRVPTFQYQQSYNISGTLISGNDVLVGITPGVLPNPSITWESASVTDIGLDGSLWKSKLEFELDYFYKRTSDILQTRIRSIPATLGADLPAENYAVVDNKGFDFTLTHNNNIGEFKYKISINGGYSKSKVITIDEPANIPDYLLQTGRPLNFMVGYKAIGFFQSDADVANSLPQFNGGQKPGDVKYADINGDGKVDQNDKTIISMDNNLPKIMGGISFGGSYKQFDFDIFFQGAAKVNLLLTANARQFFVNSNENNFSQLYDYWTPQNPNAKYPRPSVTGQTENTFDSNQYLRDASYLRLKSVKIGYTLPKSILSRISVETIRIYISGNNLFVWDKNLMFDPEASTGSGFYYPQQRSVNFGVNLTF